MNILVLTPDAVGSTLLQRVLTIYMQFHQFDKPVINLHELTNGLDRYYSPEFNRELLGKKKWGYHQTLSEVVELLSSVDHYKTSRLAQYHIRARNDAVSDQVPFYQYLNENFYIISCRRKNILEHALSWSINTITRKLNVYSATEKINTFVDLFNSRITVDPQVLLNHCHSYANYVSWCDQYFSVSNYFNYEEHVPRIERYVLDLPVFAGQPKKITWADTYGQEFADWNRCHHMTSDIGTLALESSQGLLQIAHTPDQPVAKTVLTALPAGHQQYYEANQDRYHQASQSIDRMVSLGILTSSIPIKKQTMREKKYLVRNFDQCVEVYNNWISQRPELGDPVTQDSLQLAMDQEQAQWRPAHAVPAIPKS